MPEKKFRPDPIFVIFENQAKNNYNYFNHIFQGEFWYFDYTSPPSGFIWLGALGFVGKKGITIVTPTSFADEITYEDYLNSEDHQDLMDSIQDIDLLFIKDTLLNEYEATLIKELLNDRMPCYVIHRSSMEKVSDWNVENLLMLGEEKLIINNELSNKNIRLITQHHNEHNDSTYFNEQEKILEGFHTIDKSKYAEGLKQLYNKFNHNGNIILSKYFIEIKEHAHRGHKVSAEELPQKQLLVIIQRKESKNRTIELDCSFLNDENFINFKNIITLPYQDLILNEERIQKKILKT